MKNQEATAKRDDALASLARAAERLKRSSSSLTEDQVRAADKEMEGFTKLFSKFLAADFKEDVKWEEIQILPKDAVSELKV